ncbi:MMPL family transporter [Rhodococcus sp. BP-252]|nr:MMPL family transporter [Rhodococcus sp. BP-320]MBY6417751.1 MMPL family transporter [Rhodococcus sp. BP-321]MBY6423901.1 MMPL family transporter [Rhodococcus sp. BP-324]MBY6427828.1 MMPL family transporter [Rhodococcus sp. BP-323]MBY6431827.1 MMPL family transporter [Rhodococcus sp. BP-322]MBY6441935.1 MMPL family transporter [Rhodococcus sp. BP-319]MBY6446803.1 MMPL family transporter [Rhodococcus sp. BP-318]MBY6451601.1 MMPL family transporter [Rhodococcus sp. BP-315]MBY6456378.1 MMPL
MSTLLGRLGALCAAHPWRTITVWVVLLVYTLAAAGAFGGQMQDDYHVDGLESVAGSDLLAERFPDMAGTDARVVVHDPDGLDQADLAGLGSRLRDLDGVGTVAPPRMSSDGDTALIAVQYSVPVTDFAGTEGIDALRTATAPLEREGVQVELGGQVAENISAPSGVAEAVGIVVALAILLVAFGSVVAAGLPIAVAIVGVGIGTGIIALLSAVTEIGPMAPTIATMVGIGVGIDYALLLVTRFADGLRSGLSRTESAAQANSTAGVSVVFAGTTVLLCLLGLRLAGVPVYASMGYATLAVVGAVMLTSVTLVPALCALAGPRVLGRKMRTMVGASRTERWARMVCRRPVAWAVSALVLMAILAAPVLDMRLWPQNAGTQPTSNTTRVAYDLIDAEYGPGANGPFTLAVDLTTVDIDSLTMRLADEPGIATVMPPMVNAVGDTAIVVIEPTTGPADEATTELLDRLRSDVAGDGVVVTGVTPIFADITDKLADRIWLVVAFVVALSVVLLTAVFRSIVVSLKAAAMNLLSVAAAYGVMVAIFQWGWGTELLGLPHAVPVSSWVPILMFTILFGLSMDYEVFLLSRVRELWLRSGDAHSSVVDGVASTGRVITSAAAIMVAVFLGFAMDADVTVKMMGVGLATAVFLDATVVRMVLVPATMTLLGQWNWWTPMSPRTRVTPQAAVPHPAARPHTSQEHPTEPAPAYASEHRERPTAPR